jgi:CRISPR-associated protein Csb2
MTFDFRVTVRFLQPYSHGRGEDGLPEWPPSPLRLFQAMVASAIGRQHDPDARARAVAALQWLERQPPPEIIASRVAETTEPYRLYVPDNTGDRVAKAWSAGREADLSGYRTEKDVRALRLEDDVVHYLFRGGDEAAHLPVLQAAARSMTHLGWGIDLVVGDAQEAASDALEGEFRERWLPGKHGGSELRCAVIGTLAALEHKHAQFLQRVGDGGLRPVSPLTTFAVLPYARASDPLPRPFAAFRMLSPDTGDLLMFDPVRRSRDVAAWARHGVAEVCDGWPFGATESLVHGHGTDGAEPRARFSFLPLPTITPWRAEGIARVMVAASPGLDREMEWVRARLAGHELTWNGRPVAVLEPLSGGATSPTSSGARRGVAGDSVLGHYVARSEQWSTVTPVVLPGHHDQSARKAERLLRRAFLQAGFEPDVVDAIRELDWHAVGFRPGVELATRYLRPDKVHGPLFHVRVLFANPQVGPIAIGSGRHRGLGVFAAERAGRR